MSRRMIIAGGGTGGHIFPALAIAGALKKMDSSLELLFVGAKGKMEMEKVPQAGYTIIGLDIAGFNRSSLLKNIGLPWKLLKSFWQVRQIFKQFRPHAVLGVGGYSSFPVLRYAQAIGIPNFLHEANSFAGRTNQLLAKKATTVFAGVRGLEKFFTQAKICFTGNPVRPSIVQSTVSAEAGRLHFGLNPASPTLFVVGGSLGARSINLAIEQGLDQLMKVGVQLIWQTGKNDELRLRQLMQRYPGVWIGPFINEMEYAYAAADLVVARAGALTVAELAVAEKPVVFVPFPLAAENHQTANAKQLVEQQAALLVTDGEAQQKLTAVVLDLIMDKTKLLQMQTNIKTFGVRDADQRIAIEIMKWI
ncbi:MAG: undecaprenyldiphospho-muramoylpentapeptide beta-N-acetylglucosaminyltransferase [Bacteroidetes bacterium]|nr:undecaprenyldiphospho-muramoylpentapeptide beta-N-acetylglucosaminyltransferase [Bacteroidota bacterium]